MTGAYSYQIGGPPIPADVTGFIVTQTGENVIMTWDNNDNSGIEGFDVYWSEQTQDFGAANLLTEVTRATEITTSKIPPGAWTFWIVARDNADQVSAIPASFDFTVINYNTILYQNNYIPSFTDQNYSGISSDLLCYRHWTGKLMPHGSETCDSYNVLSPPGSSIVALDMTAGGDNPDTTYFFQATFVTVGNCETLPSTETSLFVPAGYLPTAFIASDDYTSIDPNIWGWNIYVSESSGAETKQNSDILGITPDRLSYVDQIWQMPATGLISGSSVPSQNTTGWEVFDSFIPNPEASAVFMPVSQIDNLVEANKRVWMNVDRRLGPGETDGPQKSGGVTLVFSQNLLYGSTSITPYGDQFDNFFIGNLSERYLWPFLVLSPLPGHVYYLNQFTFGIDNSEDTTSIKGVSIASSGSIIDFVDYNLAYHQPPSVQVSISSGSAIGGQAVATSSDVTVSVYSSTGAIAGLVDLTITGV